MKNDIQVPSSFRDPSGSLFFRRGILFRKVNEVYKENYDQLMSSGLYKKLVNEQLLIPHKELKLSTQPGVYKLIKPELVSFISYPYEWCFSQLKDAALTTLTIQKLSLEYGMTLKDASAYNIQFHKRRPIFIDTLSFEEYEDGKPWVAYKQFCQHFLAPLLLIVYKDVRLNRLSQIFIDGVPLDLASLLLPKRTYFDVSFLSHIHLHAKSQKYFESKKVSLKTQKVNKQSILAIIDNLEGAISKLKWERARTEWGDYYSETNYSISAMQDKKSLVEKFIKKANPKKSVWDIGANTGLFSRLSGSRGLNTISFDIDPLAVEKNYHLVKENLEENLLPLIIDFTNPSPGVGWENEERDSLLKRGPADCILALALIHHLAISNNLPIAKIAEFFARYSTWLVIEFVPKSDSQVKRLLANREDIFPDYSKVYFEDEFSKHFNIIKATKIKKTQRTLYLMRSN